MADKVAGVAVPPAVSQARILDYVGDGTNDREIDLGDDYDWIRIIVVDTKAHNVDHLCYAECIGTAIGVLVVLGATVTKRHYTGTGATDKFQGKMTGADANKIKLGTNGAHVRGTNNNGWNFRIMAMKLR